MHHIPKIIFVILFSLIVFFSAWPIAHGNVDFNTDIARDFLLLEDVYFNQNITLLGPRSGGIPGVFHGPLWLYLNIPAFILGAGNPIIVGWFWVLLLVLSTLVLFQIAKRLFDEKVAMMSSLIYSSVFGSSIYGLLNPAGAIMLFPLFFYFFWQYLKHDKVLYLALSYLLLGCIIQFQAAFGGPILILTLIYTFFHAWKKKSVRGLLIIPIILIPLSTYIFFDIRHDFLQTKAIVNYLNGTENLGKENLPFRDLLYRRFDLLVKDCLGLISYNSLWLSFLTGISIVLGSVKKGKRDDSSHMYGLFFFFLIGYWIVTLAYRGVVWDYYFTPFMGVIALFFAASYKNMNKALFIGIFTILLLNNIQVLYWKTYDYDFKQGTWIFFHRVAETVFKDAPPEFGYYAYSTDLYAYSSKYAMSFIDRNYSNKKGAYNEKKSTTYLLIDDPGDLASTNHNDWKLYDVKITNIPMKTTKISDSYKIETYSLSDGDLKIESNPFLLNNSLMFR